MSVSQLRPVDVEDLLGRDPVELDNVAVAKYLSGKQCLLLVLVAALAARLCVKLLKCILINCFSLVKEKTVFMK